MLLLFCLHCGAFSRFASFCIASAPKGFFARVVMETQHMKITGPVAWRENVTALACLCKIPLAAVVFFLFCIPRVFSVVSSSFFVFFQNVVSPKNLFVGLFYLIFDFILCFVCFYHSVCVFLLFSVLPFFLYLVHHLFVCFIFVETDTALLLESKTEWNHTCAHSQCSCHLVRSNPLRGEKKIRLDWAWLASMVILGSY